MAPRGIGHHKESSFNPAESQPPFFVIVVTSILSVKPVRVQKDTGGVVEWDAVLGNILRGFAFIPFKLHTSL